MPRKVIYTKELLEAIVPQCFSYAAVVRKLGLRVAGGNFATVQRRIDQFGIDISHMRHAAHNAGMELKAFDNLISKSAIRKRIVRTHNGACDICGTASWQGKPLGLELDHIDGNNRNNHETNLQMICPNCHSQTPTFRNRKRHAAPIR